MLKSHIVEFFVLLCASGLRFLHTQKLTRNAGSCPFQTCWGSICIFTNFPETLKSQKAPVSRMISQEPRGQAIVLAAQHPEWEHWTPSPKVSIMFPFFISPKLQLWAPSVSSAPTRGTPSPPRGLWCGILHSQRKGPLFTGCCGRRRASELPPALRAIPPSFQRGVRRLQSPGTDPYAYLFRRLGRLSASNSQTFLFQVFF